MNALKNLSPPPRDDVAIVGAGSAGLILAIALADAGLRVAVLDRATVRRTETGAPQAPSDGRVFVLSAGSTRVLDGLGLWDGLAAGAAAVNDIRVSDRAGPALVHFDHAELGEGPFGHVVAADALQAALLRAARARPAIRFLAPVRLKNLVVSSDRARIELADGGVIDARLVVGADGRASALRRAARINVTEWSYDQVALVLTVAHARPHQGVAEEKFLAGGPFAILPMPDGEDGTHRSSVVWAEAAARAADLLALAPDDFAAELARRFGDHLGAIRVMGERWSYPLALTLAESYIAHRVALIGDAAHAIHPIAGQGLNLGIRDAAALAEVIVDGHRLGLDIGMKTLLVDYQRWRRFDNTCLAAATDILNRLFAVGGTPFHKLRQAGMAVLNRVPPLRRLFVREAMGLAGELPRLVRGERL